MTSLRFAKKFCFPFRIKRFYALCLEAESRELTADSTQPLPQLLETLVTASGRARKHKLPWFS
jgi:hypothetical protein